MDYDFVCRVVHVLIMLIQSYFGKYLQHLDVKDITISLLFIALIAFNFKLSEIIYDKVVAQFFH